MSAASAISHGVASHCLELEKFPSAEIQDKELLELVLGTSPSTQVSYQPGF